MSIRPELRRVVDGRCSATCLSVRSARRVGCLVCPAVERLEKASLGHQRERVWRANGEQAHQHGPHHECRLIQIELGPAGGNRRSDVQTRYAPHPRDRERPQQRRKRAHFDRGRQKPFRARSFVLRDRAFYVMPNARPRSATAKCGELTRGLRVTFHQVDARRNALARQSPRTAASESLRKDADEASSGRFVTVAQRSRARLAIALKPHGEARDVGLAQVDRVRQGDSMRACAERL